MNPELITKLLDGDLFHYECPKCKEKSLLQTKILINSPKGLFWIDLESDHDSLISIFREYEIIDENNKVITADFSIDELIDHHQSIDESDTEIDDS